MKSKLTLSIDEEKIKKIKHYSKKEGISISKIVEESIDKIIAKPPKKKMDAKELIGLFGEAPKNFDADKIRWEHLKKKHGL